MYWYIHILYQVLPGYMFKPCTYWMFILCIADILCLVCSWYTSGMYLIHNRYFLSTYWVPNMCVLGKSLVHTWYLLGIYQIRSMLVWLIPVPYHCVLHRWIKNSWWFSLKTVNLNLDGMLYESFVLHAYSCAMYSRGSPGSIIEFLIVRHCLRGASNLLFIINNIQFTFSDVTKRGKYPMFTWKKKLQKYMIKLIKTK